LRIYEHRKLSDHAKVQNTSDTKDSTNGKKPSRAPRIQKLDFGVKKNGGNDIDWFNPCGD
jgi:hypothetical protein